MTPERYRKVGQIFHAALDVATELLANHRDGSRAK